MRWERHSAAVVQALHAARFQAQTVARVSLKKGLVRGMTLGGARVIARELLRGKASPSLVFRLQAENAPHRAAIVDLSQGEARAYSYYEVNSLMDRVAAALSAHGIRRGDSVILMLHNRAECVILQGGIGRLGASAVNISYRSTSAELGYLAENSGARAIFFEASLASIVRGASLSVEAANLIALGPACEGFGSYDDLLASARPGDAPEDRGGDAAVVTYTSGTTGKPKGAVRRFPRNQLASALAFIGETPMHVGDVHLAACPLYHATAYGFVTLSLVVGATIVMMGDFKPEAFLEAIEHHHVTTTAVVPTMLHRVLDLGPDVIARYDTSTLSAVFTGGAPLPPRLGARFMDAFGDILYNFYGATETGLVTLAKPADLRAAPATIGRVVPGNELRLVKDDGSLARVGEVGELYARSSMLIEGYHANADATRASMSDGYFSVGDLARVDSEGRYFLEGRKRDMIISGGVNVYPAEVENVLQEHPDVVEAAVIGVPDAEWGERVRAFVVLRQGASSDDAALTQHCRASLSGPKIPRDFVHLTALPRNPTGKVLKRVLSEDPPKDKAL